MPPLVILNGADGFETTERGDTTEPVRRGSGTIDVEASAVSKDGRLSDTQLGLWLDTHIPQFHGIGELCQSRDGFPFQHFAVVTVSIQ